MKISNEKDIVMGFIGAGWIVEHAHLVSYSKMNIKLGAIFDFDYERAKKVADKFGIEVVCQDIEKFWNSGVNAVVIATPNFTHYEYAKEALKREINVLCEKPVTIKTEEVIELCRIANETETVFLPGFVNRFRLDICKIKELLKEGTIGELKSIETGWIRKNGVPRLGSWFTSSKLSGGGVLIDIGTHILDIALSFINCEGLPESIQMETNKLKNNGGKQYNASWFRQVEDKDKLTDVDVEEFVYAKMNYQNGKTLHATVAWRSDLDGDCTFFNLHGTKGEIQLRTLFGFSNDCIYDKRHCMIKRDDLEEIIYFDQEGQQEDAFLKLNQFFVDSILGKESGHLSSQDAIKVVETIEHMYKCEQEIDDEMVEMYLTNNNKLFEKLY